MAKHPAPNAKDHPRIVELIEQELLIENNNERPENQQYNKGWIAGSAMLHFSTALANASESSPSEVHLVEYLCAEIGFWRAMVDMHRSMQGMPMSTRRKISG